MPTRPDTQRLLRTALRGTARLILLALAVLVTACLVVLIVLPRATHGVALTVLTGSMTPEIPVGSVVVVRPVDPRTLQVGDVATYQIEEGREAFITHRITNIHDKPEGLTFTFKGDANRGADIKPVPAGAVRGQVWFHVPYLGGIRDALHGKGGVTLFAMLLMAGYAISQVSAGLRDRRADRNATDSGPIDLAIRRTLIYAEFPRRTDAQPVELAHRWSALLLDFDQDHVSMLIAPPEAGVEAALELLRGEGPTVLRTLVQPVLHDGAGPDGPVHATRTEVNDATVHA